MLLLLFFLSTLFVCVDCEANILPVIVFKMWPAIEGHRRVQTCPRNVASFAFTSVGRLCCCDWRSSFRDDAQCILLCISAGKSSGIFFFCSSTFKEKLPYYSKQKVARHSLSVCSVNFTFNKQRRRSAAANRANKKLCGCESRSSTVTTLVIRRDAAANSLGRLRGSQLPPPSRRRETQAGRMQSGRTARKNANEPNAAARLPLNSEARSWNQSGALTSTAKVPRIDKLQNFATTARRHQAAATPTKYKPFDEHKSCDDASHSTNASYSKNRDATRQTESLASGSPNIDLDRGACWRSSDVGARLSHSVRRPTPSPEICRRGALRYELR